MTTPTGALDVRGDEVRIWDGTGTVDSALSGGELYVEGDLEVDATAYINTGNITSLVLGTNGIATTGNINTTKIDGYNYFMSSVGIGTSTPGVSLDIVGGDGRVETGRSWLTNSDVRLKKNITTLKDSLKKVLAIRGVRFDLISEGDRNEGAGGHIGFVAQELENEIPELVSADEKGIKAVDYGKLTAVLVEAIKEQQRQLGDLRARLAKLEAGRGF